MGIPFPKSSFIFLFSFLGTLYLFSFLAFLPSSHEIYLNELNLFGVNLSEIDVKSLLYSLTLIYRLGQPQESFVGQYFLGS